MAHIMDGSRNYDAQQLQVCELACEGVTRQQPGERLHHVRGVHAVVVGVALVPKLHCLWGQDTLPFIHASARSWPCL